jgi:uncharacterized MnhB-related membrane protein
MIWLVALIVFIMLIAAVSVLLVQSNVSAVALSAAVSLALSILFVILKAPDVAMTEAVVGSGLSAVILALALNRIHRIKKSGTEAENDA